MGSDGVFLVYRVKNSVKRSFTNRCIEENVCPVESLINIENENGPIRSL